MASKAGEKHHSNKIKESDVIEIRNTFMTYSNRYWSKKLNVSDSAISLIRSNKTWKHLIN